MKVVVHQLVDSIVELCVKTALKTREDAGCDLQSRTVSNDTAPGGKTNRLQVLDVVVKLFKGFKMLQLK